MVVRLLCLYVLRGTDRLFRRFLTGGCVCVCVCLAVSDPKNSKLNRPISEFVYCAIEKKILCLPETYSDIDLCGFEDSGPSCFLR